MGRFSERQQARRDRGDPELIVALPDYTEAISEDLMFAKFDQVGRDLVVPIESIDLILQILNASARAQEAVRR